jgi:hypothetical protein
MLDQCGDQALHALRCVGRLASRILLLSCLQGGTDSLCESLVGFRLDGHDRRSGQGPTDEKQVVVALAAWESVEGCLGLARAGRERETAQVFM